MTDNPHLILKTDDEDSDKRDDESESIPPEIIERANEVINNLTPATSRSKYESAYRKFMLWRTAKRITSFSEAVFLKYFSELSETLLPSSLWAKYSMLRSMVDIKHNLNIFNYSRLIAFLKQKNKGFKSKKARTLSPEQIDRFLREAPDREFLATKVALIFGVLGACRRKELCNVMMDDIQDKGDMLLVKVPDTKTGKSRSFIVTNEFYDIYKKYAKSRPTNLKTKRFFISYRNGKCTTQNIGINTFGGMPKKWQRF
ncbi:PREDICTED: uncharacterized protein LOC107066566 [Polistes dominula]|uniref:Uncharacterized protein LOC107066566 n=1 Tax=Polistes dominula TaxID=743375 RepID=A0ABM1I9B5_POLDO|nr:PREDICTED: uncharacterized protein LOC107066566 [Polistes dominula]